MQLIDSSERADTLLSKRTGGDSNQSPCGYEPLRYRCNALQKVFFFQWLGVSQPHPNTQGFSCQPGSSHGICGTSAVILKYKSAQGATKKTRKLPISCFEFPKDGVQNGLGGAVPHKEAPGVVQPHLMHSMLIYKYYAFHELIYCL